MNRRDSLKALGIGTLSASALLAGCKPGAENKNAADDIKVDATGRQEFEIDRDKKLLSEKKFFDDREMATITILADIIIPRDEKSGSASEAKVPDFIEFIVKDKPEHQVPMRGGLRWLDLHSLKHFDKTFSDLSATQRLEIVDKIAYPLKAKAEHKQGVAFFSLMRNLTISGFYTTPMGVQDVGYMGNRPNQWNGVPDDVLKQYNMAYTEKELKESLSF